jgi:hypothetical protein
VVLRELKVKTSSLRAAKLYWPSTLCLHHRLLKRRRSSLHQIQGHCQLQCIQRARIAQMEDG